MTFISLILFYFYFIIFMLFFYRLHPLLRTCFLTICPYIYLYPAIYSNHFYFFDFFSHICFFLEIYYYSNTHTFAHKHSHKILPYCVLLHSFQCTVYSQIGSVSPDCAGSQLTDLRNCFECVQVHPMSSSLSTLPCFTHNTT